MENEHFTIASVLELIGCFCFILIVYNLFNTFIIQLKNINHEKNNIDNPGP